jgi:ornithine lipid ester-linked acyl 2-hydroxylase
VGREARKQSQWSGAPARDVAGRVAAPPALTLVPGPSEPDRPRRADPGRPWLIRYGRHLRGPFDRFVARFSLVSTEPLLDVRDFAWTQALRAQWRTIRAEACAAALDRTAPSPAAIAPRDRWRAFPLWRYGDRIDDNVARCPVTARVVEQIPGLVSAGFSILAPGAHLPAHRGPTKGLITCHLGLIVPRDGDVRMRVGERVVRWAEGETLVFDDSYDHEVWNETGGTRVVLLVQFRRPLRAPGRWFVDALLAMLRRSAFVQEARDNLSRRNAAIRALKG